MPGDMNFLLEPLHSVSAVSYRNVLDIPIVWLMKCWSGNEGRVTDRDLLLMGAVYI